MSSDRFTGKSDLGLWRIKMHALLVQQCVVEALKGAHKMDAALTAEKRMIYWKRLTALSFLV